jgi:hypothetical protein
MADSVDRQNEPQKDGRATVRAFDCSSCCGRVRSDMIAEVESNDLLFQSFSEFPLQPMTNRPKWTEMSFLNSVS